MKIDKDMLRASWRSWYANDLRAVGPGWLQLLWTFVFSSVVGLCFFVLGLATLATGSGRLPSWAGAGQWLLANLVVSWIIGACIHGLFAVLVPLLGAERIRAFSRRGQSLFFAGVPLAGLALGWPMGAFVASNLILEKRWFPFRNAETVVGAFLLAVLVTFIFYKHFQAKARQIEAEKRVTEAQLRLLQGQMEPPFLFNTLANVHALIDHEPARAKAMLGSFTDYLRASLGGLRRHEAPLSDELALAEAYLQVQQTRMDERLRFSIDAAPDVRLANLPPMILQPLVENAIHHGLEPQLNGGRVSVRALAEGGQLRLEVQDDGRGLRAPPRKGARMALQNLRERLRGLYGDEARLELLEQDVGTLARVTLPLNLQASSR
ncbi:MAG: sensor histidine kinase [Rubrivivax sp.]